MHIFLLIKIAILSFNILIFAERPFEFIESSRGGYILVMQGHTFVKMNKSAHNWYCSRRISRKCRAKVRINEEGTEVVCFPFEHNHPPRACKARQYENVHYTS